MAEDARGKFRNRQRDVRGEAEERGAEAALQAGGGHAELLTTKHTKHTNEFLSNRFSLPVTVPEASGRVLTDFPSAREEFFPAAASRARPQFRPKSEFGCRSHRVSKSDTMPRGIAICPNPSRDQSAKIAAIQRRRWCGARTAVNVVFVVAARESGDVK